MPGIYVHIPFCSQACHYCDFHFSTSLKIKSRIISCIQREIELKKKYLSQPLIESVYFGGGTPSLLSSKHINQILTSIRQQFKLAKKVEITIEANPEDVTENKINNWLSIGVNRVSLGVQSFRNKDLKYMNRSHNRNQSLIALDLLTNSAINNICIDLIYGFPHLRDVDWTDNLNQALQFNIQHISCYCLTIEKKTPLYYFIKNKKEQPLNPEMGARQFLKSRQTLQSEGYIHYEISNFSKPGFKSIHNQNYWNRSSYIGIGPSAHSFNGYSRQWNISNNTKYCEKIENNTNYYNIEVLTRKNIINEYILTSIRTSTGIDIENLSNSMHMQELKILKNQIKNLKKLNMVCFNNEKIILTEKGMLFADSISEDLFLI